MTTLPEDLGEKLSEPIVFTARGLTPDVRLQVFDQEYHVHSVILKMQSAFFFKFLDSADKSSRSKTMSMFAYEWVTEVDKDGKSWALVASDEKDRISNNMVFSGDIKDEIEAFSNLLSAMYGKRYSLSPTCALALVQLQLLTQLADYYCSLPAVSRSMTQILIDKDYYIDEHAEDWIAVAYKLRHAALFRECVVYLAGNWEGGVESSLGAELDPKIRNVVALARTRTTTKIAEVHSNLFFECSQKKYVKDAVIKILESKSACQLPRYYRALFAYDHPDDTGIRYLILDLIAPLVENNLKFCGHNISPGAKLLTDYFLCATVSDEELPWDIHQEDY